MMEKEIRSIIDKLNTASNAYYNGEEIMSNIEWDSLFDRLKQLESESNIIFPDSPTQSVGFVPKVGTRVTHEFPAKSLDKTKDIDVLVSKMSSEEKILLMWKLDGGTLQITYEGGTLKVAATRGNGEVGQDITRNAKYIHGIPVSIPYTGKLTLRGEALMSYENFEKINRMLPENEQYANPRNLANATVSMLDYEEVKKRGVHFKAFSIVDMGDERIDKFDERMIWLSNQGFDTVEWECIDVKDIPKAVEKRSFEVRDYPYPVDGLVVSSNNIAFAESLPGTGHHPNVLSGYAFKWADTEAETILEKIEWSASRTGLLNPVAVFKSVELEGTTVSRASLHNFSYVKDKHLRIGDPITVYKANMIIPQVNENLSDNKLGFSEAEVSEITPNCPVCGTKAQIKEANGILTMHCPNSNCTAKKLGSFVHFCERDAMDIEGLSEATISKFIDWGFLKTLDDIYKLDRFEEEIVSAEGFGKKSFDNLMAAVEQSKQRDIVSFINAVGIPGVGKGQARLIAIALGGNANKIIKTIFNNDEPQYDFTLIDGIGTVINDAIHNFNTELMGELLSKLNIQDIQVSVNNETSVSGKTFVITGNVEHYANRSELKKQIEALGGKVTGSVTSKTDYLINNDLTSTSGKNKKAKELNIPIISEDDFRKMAGA